MDGSWAKIFSGANDAGKRPRRRIVLTVILSVAVLIAGGVFSWFRFRSTGPTEAAPVVIKTETPLSVPESPVQESPAPEVGTDAPYQSEHYRAGEIAIGGEMGLFVPESDPSPISIGSVRGEAFSANGKNGSKLVVTWETNKPARSRISYGKGVGQAEAVIEETEYGTNHSVIIPDVTPASTYVYVISVTDKWGGSAQSDPYAVYTGAKTVSLFELIAGAVGEVFGWAVKK
ncbi:MAG: hypothetical protein HGB37_04165 [Candidatus Moranbacteria bacterium]|nr:hypothetical protein [Candidatus Moranbacteria bacterium]